MTTTWTIAIDWERTGTFDGTYDDVTDLVISANWFLGMRKPYADVADDSMLKLVLNNSDRRFSPENSNSALFGWLAPFRPIRIQSNNGTTIRTHYSGWVESIEPGVNQYGERRVTITCAGAMLFFENIETNIELQENKRTSEIIDVLLDEVRIPPSLEDDTTTGKQSAILDYPGANLDEIVLPDVQLPRSLQDGRTRLPYAADNWTRQPNSPDAPRQRFNVYHAIKDVTAAERGRFFFNRDGEAVFWNRHNLLLEQTVQATFDNSMTDLKYTFAGLDEFKNDIQVLYHPRKLGDGSNTLLAEMVYDPDNPTEGIILRKGEERDINISYQDEDANRVGAKEVYITNVVWAGAALVTYVDADGYNRTTSVNAYPGHLTLIPKANGATLRFRTENRISHLLAYEIRGQAVIDMGEKEMSARDGLSIMKYGQRTLRMNLPSLQHNEVAQDVADFELARRKEPSGKVSEVTLKSHGKAGGDHHADQLKLTVGHRIRVKEQQSGHDSEYFIIGEAHRLSDSASLLETTWYLESATESNWAILDTAELDGEGANAPERPYVLAY